MESGGDNLTATFSPALVDAQIFVIDVAGGGDVARKGGPGIERADLLVVNKTDLAPYVGVDVDADARRRGRGPRRPAGRRAVAARPARPWTQLLDWVRSQVARHRTGGWCRPTPGRWRRTSTQWTTGPATQSTTSTGTAMTTTPTRTDVCSISLARTAGGRVRVTVEAAGPSA